MDHAGYTISAACRTEPNAQPPAPSTRRSGKPFLAVASALLVVIMGNNIPSPLYAVYQQRWHFCNLTLTAVFAVVAVAVLPT